MVCPIDEPSLRNIVDDLAILREEYRQRADVVSLATLRGPEGRHFVAQLKVETRSKQAVLDTMSG